MNYSFQALPQTFHSCAVSAARARDSSQSIVRAATAKNGTTRTIMRGSPCMFATAYTPERICTHLYCTGVLITIAHIATLVYTSSFVIPPLLVHCTRPFMQAGPLILTARSADPARIPRRCTQRICIQDLPGISSLGRSSFSLSCLVYACGVCIGYLDNMRSCKHCVRMVGVAAAIIAAYTVRSCTHIYACRAHSIHKWAVTKPPESI
uniref:Uncharacterized protein n=1 Tax=Trichogramma kaykai TaxID=54128 RepID=A0ABD2VW39_9HYME